MRRESLQQETSKPPAGAGAIRRSQGAAEPRGNNPHLQEQQEEEPAVGSPDLCLVGFQHR